MNSIRHNSVTSLSTASSYPLYMTTTPRPHCTALPGLTLTPDQIATHPRPQPGTGHADTALDTWCGHADMLRVNTPQLDTSLDGRNCQHQPPSCYKPIDKLDISIIYVDMIILDRDLVKYSNVDLKIMFYIANKNVSEYRVFQQFYHNCSHTCNCQCHVDVDIYLQGVP